MTKPKAKDQLPMSGGFTMTEGYPAETLNPVGSVRHRDIPHAGGMGGGGPVSGKVKGAQRVSTERNTKGSY